MEERNFIDYLYDVMFSYTIEDREYVEQCVRMLELLGIKVFYDKDEESTLCGFIYLFGRRLFK